MRSTHSQASADPTPVPPGLTVDGRQVCAWPRVVSVRGPAVPGGRCTAVYYAGEERDAGGKCCGLVGSEHPKATRIEQDVDDPSSQPGVARWRPIHGLRVLVIVNPFAGRGVGTRLARTVLGPLLRDAGIDAVFRYTDRPGHASDLAAEAAASPASSPVAAVISIGGDGTFHEVVNGLTLSCNQARSLHSSPGAAKSLPLIGVVPAGSGNAVAVSMGVSSVLSAGLNIIHALRTRAYRTITLMHYGRFADRRRSGKESSSPRLLTAVCGMQWGLIADADLGTESLRWLGDTRYDVGGLIRIIRNRTFYARIRLQLHRSLQYEVDKRLERSGGGSRGRALERGGDQDVILEGRFITAVAWNCAYQSKSFAMTPYARVDEPCFDVILAREGSVGRAGLLKTMLKLSQGNDNFLQDGDGFEYYKCKRLCFERIEGDFLSIDGESVPVEPFFLTVSPDSGRVRLLDCSVLN